MATFTEHDIREGLKRLGELALPKGIQIRMAG
jgi:hypothetical protein